MVEVAFIRLSMWLNLDRAKNSQNNFRIGAPRAWNCDINNRNSKRNRFQVNYGHVLKYT